VASEIAFKMSIAGPDASWGNDASHESHDANKNWMPQWGHSGLNQCL